MQTDPKSFDPAPGVAVDLQPGLRRILAPNPSAMTFRGTNTYLIGTRAIAVIDPGPAIMSHLDAILSAIKPGQHVSHILVTHAHLDHSPLARTLSDRSGAPILAYGGAASGRSALMQTLAARGIGGGEGVDEAFRPDVQLRDGQAIEADDWCISALWTPGHMANHMAFAWRNTLLTGDLVMGWASSLVSPPDGDMGAYMNSCARLQKRCDKVFYPGHGSAITAPRKRVDWLMAHRRKREAEILDGLRAGAATARTLAQGIYKDIDDALHAAAERNVFSHLIDLSERGVAEPVGDLASSTSFHLVSPRAKKTPNGYGRP